MYTPTKQTSSSSMSSPPVVVTSPNGKGVVRGEAICLCALCTCGKHRCPPRPTEPLKFNGSSTYHSDYPEWPSCPVHGVTIPHKEFERLPFNAQSTYAHDFVPHPLQAPATNPTVSSYPSKPAVHIPFQGISETQARYKEFNVAPSDIRWEGPKFSPAKQEKLPFNATTTNLHDYQPWNIQPVTVPAVVSPPRINTKFEGESEAQARYKEFNVAPSDIRWEGPKPTPSKQEKLPFNATTTNLHDYQPWDIKPEQPSVMPAHKLPSLPFNGTSETMDKYRAWELAQPEKSVPLAPYQPRPDDRDFLSEAHKQYTEKEVPRCPVESLPSAPLPSVQPSAWEGSHVLYSPQKHRFA